MISCKAAIDPGVTEFGSRFDLLNDATLLILQEMKSIHPFQFKEIITLRYSSSITTKKMTTSLEEFSMCKGRSVAGNVRAVVFAVNYLNEICDDSIGLLDIEKSLKYLASEYYWPLLEELEPKLGRYEPLVIPAQELAEVLYKIVSEQVDKPDYGPSCLIHRDAIERLKKLFEILEYAGFLVKRDSSRAMKSGGRGTRYVLNLCNLLEVMPSNRLTSDLFSKWNKIEKEYTQIHRKGDLDKISLPELKEVNNLGILDKDLTILAKSKVYPYGLTAARITILESSGLKTVGDLALATDEELLDLNRIGDHWLNRIRSVTGQAIWM